ncbi:VTT domain-containing protein [Membranicola marinus]|uniref:VTT domain-containing protein n=1 Tax=Membranihabitans marinus TaxID=1227546 RepID=A0A953HTU2_9BACT|nr:VTT domain-containing protein [Membranihabitans marinus]MBY5958210.1 VTT domain-containing protein [Membranihabitans marinus]
MDILFDSFEHLLDPDWIMQNGGLYLVLLILFIETGVFFGFFLPGDPLLFVSGMLIASVDEAYPFSLEILNLPYWLLLFMGSTIVGNFFGYWFGHKFTHFVNRKEDTWFLKQKHVQAANEFYDKRGGFAVAIARFLPIVRTFAPIVAGTVKMDFKNFTFYNVLGAVLWVGSITTLGYVLGETPWVLRNLEYIILGIILIVTLPVVLKLTLKKRIKAFPKR